MTMTRRKRVVAGMRIVLLSAVLGSLCLAVASDGNRTRAEPADPAQPGAAAKDVVQVPGLRDGVLILVGTETKGGIPEGQLIKIRIAGEEKQYRRLRVGDRVDEGDLLARLDDRMARNDWQIAMARIKAREMERIAAEKTRDEAKGAGMR